MFWIMSWDFLSFLFFFEKGIRLSEFFMVGLLVIQVLPVSNKGI